MVLHTKTTHRKDSTLSRTKPENHIHLNRGIQGGNESKNELHAVFRSFNRRTRSRGIPTLYRELSPKDKPPAQAGRSETRGSSLFKKLVRGKPSVWANQPLEGQWRETLRKSLADKNQPDHLPHRHLAVSLDFFLAPNRLTLGNDLDNLAKPVLDILVQEGFIKVDSLVCRLELTKTKAEKEGVQIQIWEWR